MTLEEIEQFELDAEDLATLDSLGCFEEQEPDITRDELIALTEGLESEVF